MEPSQRAEKADGAEAPRAFRDEPDDELLLSGRAAAKLIEIASFMVIY